MERKPKILPVIIGTALYSGLSPWAPGTAGALLATIIWFVISYFVSGTVLFVTLVSLILLSTIAGIWATDKLEEFWGEDPSRVVIDEVVGVWIALLPVAAGDYVYGLVAFALFRLLDIFKPLGIRRMENFRGGVGVMMDDILAGIYSCIIILVLQNFVC